jgi:GNAT superfamily N-acetyltransferase
VTPADLGTKADLRLRPWRDASDFDAMSVIANRAAIADGLDMTWDVGFFERYFMTADGARADPSVISIVDAGDTTVGFGYGHWEQDRPNRRTLWTRCRIDPDWRRLGIGRLLLRAAKAAAVRDAIALGPTDLPLVYRTVAGGEEPGTEALLRSDGYEPTNWITRLVRPTLDDPPDDALPAGVEARPVTPETALAVVRAMCEVFGPEWWFPGMSEAQMAASLDDPVEGQIDLWQVAWDGDTVVGGVLGFIEADENAAFGRQRGYTERIFTRREYRGRGIASALIGRNLRALRARGMTEAALSTDSDNPSGALDLYERHGFRRDRVEVGWERPV